MPHITPAHWHVLLNHIPIVGLPIIAALLLWGLARREDAVIRVALIGAILVAAGTWVVDLTGDPANHEIRSAAWYQKPVEHAHEQAGGRANIAAIVAGVAALATLIMARGGKPFKRPAALGVLFLLGVAAVLSGWAGWQGGKIRHSEFGLTAPPTAESTPPPH
jgi:hypothetical protein